MHRAFEIEMKEYVWGNPHYEGDMGSEEKHSGSNLRAHVFSLGAPHHSPAMEEGTRGWLGSLHAASCRRRA